MFLFFIFFPSHFFFTSAPQKQKALLPQKKRMIKSYLLRSVDVQKSRYFLHTTQLKLFLLFFIPSADNLLRLGTREGRKQKDVREWCN